MPRGKRTYGFQTHAFVERMYNLEPGAAEIDSEGVDEPRTGQFILRSMPAADLSVFNSR
jgi:hypothetical protein